MMTIGIFLPAFAFTLIGHEFHSGSFSRSFALSEEIGRRVLETFRDAQAAQLPLAELVVHYGSLKIVARELRGGAIVFLSPKSPISPAK